jgi:hypothetical protein
MKKKLLPLAMLAGLAGAAGTAQAVHVNPDGLGETLIYPFYSVEGNNDTYITVVNTTNRGKAVKVRFLEAMNSREVLDFNLYLSPYDHWSAVVTRGANGGGIVRTSDTSCTVPVIPTAGEPFRTVEFSGNNTDGGPTGVERTREGYVEIIEMGELSMLDGNDLVELGEDTFGAGAASKHIDGAAPTGCSTLYNAWLGAGIQGPYGQGTGIWLADPSDNLEAPGGGLYGYGVLINTIEGTNATYDAIALDNFFAPDTVFHTNPGSLEPSLGNAFPVSNILDGTEIYETSFDNYNGVGGGWNAVSSLFMHSVVVNDYVTEPSIDAGTDWVLTFPTKRAYVNGVDPADPFTRVFTNGAACEVIQMAYWDREEQDPTVPPITGDLDFSPLPPPDIVEVEPSSLCAEVNVLSWYRPDADTETGEGHVSAVESSPRITYGFQGEFYNGWASLDFTTLPERVLEGEDLESGDIRTFAGLPVVGFAVQKYTNNNVNSYFAGLINHKAVRDID